MQPSAAVIKLRKATGFGLQNFATEIRVSITSLVKYEAGRNPTGRVLVALAALAAKEGWPRLADVFWDALVLDIGLNEIDGAKDGLARHLKSEGF